MSEKAIAIITARGGSKRIPKKNIKEFCGKPIIAYSIRAALDSGIFDEVMVSTDSEEIAEIARAYGAKVPFMRSAKTSDDFATTADVLMEVLERYQEMDRTFDVMSCIYPTAPFVTPQKLQSAYDTLTKEQAVMAMPVVAFSYPPQRSYVLNGNMLEMKWKENYNKRSQDLEKMYHDAGQFYMYQVEAFVRLKGQMTESIVPVIVDEMEVQDIDNESDWKLAELKYQMIKMRNK
ncbi:pseudaminic acid cytidylyltransferase [Jutongia sp.]|uniref:pseudaminic acid cytidylyltransferase n=1 Tax=Jutongia sp. TaxID=2944204 RepID=UPI003079B421